MPEEEQEQLSPEQFTNKYIEDLEIRETKAQQELNKRFIAYFKDNPQYARMLSSLSLEPLHSPRYTGKQKLRDEAKLATYHKLIDISRTAITLIYICIDNTLNSFPKDRGLKKELNKFREKINNNEKALEQFQILLNEFDSQKEEAKYLPKWARAEKINDIRNRLDAMSLKIPNSFMIAFAGTAVFSGISKPREEEQFEVAVPT